MVNGRVVGSVLLEVVDLARRALVKNVPVVQDRGHYDSRILHIWEVIFNLDQRYVWRRR